MKLGYILALFSTLILSSIDCSYRNSFETWRVSGEDDLPTGRPRSRAFHLAKDSVSRNRPVSPIVSDVSSGKEMRRRIETSEESDGNLGQRRGRAGAFTESQSFMKDKLVAFRAKRSSLSVPIHQLKSDLREESQNRMSGSLDATKKSGSVDGDSIIKDIAERAELPPVKRPRAMSYADLQELSLKLKALEKYFKNNPPGNKNVDMPNGAPSLGRKRSKGMSEGIKKDSSNSSLHSRDSFLEGSEGAPSLEGFLEEAKSCLPMARRLSDCTLAFDNLINAAVKVDPEYRSPFDDFANSNLMARLYTYKLGVSIPGQPSALTVPVLKSILSEITFSNQYKIYIEFLGHFAEEIFEEADLQAILADIPVNDIPKFLDFTIFPLASPRNWSSTGHFYVNLKLLWFFNRERLISCILSGALTGKKWYLLRYIPLWKQIEDEEEVRLYDMVDRPEHLLLSLDLYLHIKKLGLLETRNSLYQRIAQVEVKLKAEQFKVWGLKSELATINEDLDKTADKVMSTLLRTKDSAFRSLSRARLLDLILSAGTQALAEMYITYYINQTAENTLSVADVRRAYRESRLRQSTDFPDTICLVPVDSLLTNTMSVLKFPETPRESGTAVLDWDPSVLALFFKVLIGDVSAKEVIIPESSLNPPLRMVVNMLKEISRSTDSPIHDPCISDDNGPVDINWDLPDLSFLNDQPWQQDDYLHEYYLIKIFLYMKFGVPLWFVETESVSSRPKMDNELIDRANGILQNWCKISHPLGSSSYRIKNKGTFNYKTRKSSTANVKKTSALGRKIARIKEALQDLQQGLMNR